MNLLLKIVTTLGLSLFISLQHVHAVETNFLYIGDKTKPAFLGANQGLSEANLQGQFLNLKYSIDIIDEVALANTDIEQYSAILVANEDSGKFANIANQFPSVPVFNLTNKDNELREMCISNAFHTIPNQQMYLDAEKQMQQKEPGTGAKAQGWHPDFVKFAARDLNKRYVASTGIPMDDFAWAGWAAVKLTSDSVARMNASDPSALIEYFKTSLVFDGQKGTNMGFRNSGQLEQIMLMVENEKIIAEAPIRGVAKSLDSLGLLECK